MYVHSDMYVGHYSAQKRKKDKRHNYVRTYMNTSAHHNIKFYNTTSLA